MNNLTLDVNNKKVLPGSAATTTTTMGQSESNFLESTTVKQGSGKNKITGEYSEIGKVLAIAHEGLHSKLGLASNDDNNSHTLFNEYRSEIKDVLREYSKDNKLGLSDKIINDLSFAGTVGSKQFNSYLTGLAKQNKTTIKAEHDAWDVRVSKVLYIINKQ